VFALFGLVVSAVLAFLVFGAGIAVLGWVLLLLTVVPVVDLVVISL
jgi:hypothetical protein